MTNPAPGDPRYDGFRINEMWALTAIDPDDDQEGIVVVADESGGKMPAVGSDRTRLESQLLPLAEKMRKYGIDVHLKRFRLTEVDEVPVDSVLLDNDPDFEAYVTHVRAELIPKIQDSAMTLALVPDGDTDVKFAIELGLSIMFDKPILAIVPKGVTLPPKLRAVLDEAVEVDFEDMDASGPAIAAAIKKIQDR